MTRPGIPAEPRTATAPTVSSILTVRSTHWFLRSATAAQMPAMIIACNEWQKLWPAEAQMIPARPPDEVQKALPCHSTKAARRPPMSEIRKSKVMALSAFGRT